MNNICEVTVHEEVENIYCYNISETEKEYKVDLSYEDGVMALKTRYFSKEDVFFSGSLMLIGDDPDIKKDTMSLSCTERLHGVSLV